MQKGEIYKSNYCGDFEILSEVKYTMDENNKFGKYDIKYNEKQYIIRFIDTGFTTRASRSAIRFGRVKDKYLNSVANIGSIGYDIKITDPKYYEYYKAWNDMINRCYNPEDKDYYAYGALGITVDPRWFVFIQYYHDIQHIPGYENKIKYPSEYQIDKDYKQLYIPKSKRVYSPETCIWISKFDNIMIMNRDDCIEKGIYFGVSYKDNAWCTKMNNDIYGRFTTAEAAASLFNYIYPLLTRDIPHHDIMILNDIQMIPYDELINYTINKQRWLNDYPTWSTVQANWK